MLNSDELGDVRVVLTSDREIGRFLPAGRAPGPPHVDHHYLARVVSGAHGAVTTQRRSSRHRRGTALRHRYLGERLATNEAGLRPSARLLITGSLRGAAGERRNHEATSPRRPDNGGAEPAAGDDADNGPADDDGRSHDRHDAERVVLPGQPPIAQHRVTGGPGSPA